jgi:putative oxidoreductase
VNVDWALLIIRVVLGVVMLMHAWNHWFGGGKVAGTAGWFGSLGLRQPVMQAWMSIVTEIAAGGGLILGLLTPLAAAAAIGPMVVAFALVHRKNGFFIFRDGYEYVLLIAVVAVAVAVAGPGEISLDHAIGIDTDLDGWVGLIIALVGGLGGTALLLAAFYRPAPTDVAA